LYLLVKQLFLLVDVFITLHRQRILELRAIVLLSINQTRCLRLRIDSLAQFSNRLSLLGSSKVRVLVVRAGVFGATLF
jgi:hypothetical protein